MIEEIKKLIKSDPKYKTIVKEISDNPYIEKHKLIEAMDIPDEDMEKLLTALEDKQIILELASQADSSVESRVPKTIYLINPEIKDGIKAIL